MIDDMAVYIANLGKYNEGYLVGAWFTFPIDEEDVKEKIGLNEQYEEYAIHDTDNFPIAIGEYVSIEELNEMYEMIEELPDYIVECLDEFISHYGTLEEVVEHKDDIYYYPDCETMTDVAYYYWCCIIKVDTLFSRILIYNHNQYSSVSWVEYRQVRSVHLCSSRQRLSWFHSRDNNKYRPCVP